MYWLTTNLNWIYHASLVLKLHTRLVITSGFFDYNHVFVGRVNTLKHSEGCLKVIYTIFIMLFLADFSVTV